MDGCALSICLFLSLTIMVRGDCPAEREQPLHDEALLHSDLLCAYNSDYRPVKDHKSAVNVKVRLALKYLSFDSLEETLTLHSWVALTWKDEFLTWTPSDYGNIKEIQLQTHEIWTPSMALFNADASQYPSDSFYTTCLVSNDGTVTCVPHLAHAAICRTSLERWPYDDQKCIMYFGSWMHTGEQVNFTFYQKRPVVTDDFQNGPGWELLNVTNVRLPGKYGCCPNSTYPMLKYTFTLKREAAGPAAIVVVPSVVLVLLTLSCSLIDVRDNTRLYVAMFSLFSHFIFLTEIGYDIPKHSSSTPYILLFIRDSMLMTLFVILSTLVLMSLRRRVVPPPTWLVSTTRLVHRGPGKYVVFTEFDPADLSGNKVLAEEGSPTNTSEERARSSSEWMQFANLINSLLFIVSFLTYAILIICYIPRHD